MTVIKQDEGQLHKEQEAISKKQREHDERSKYLEMLKGSRKFQKYIVKEIFEEILENVYNLDNVPMSDDEKSMGATVRQFKLARAGFKKVIDKLKP